MGLPSSCAHPDLRLKLFCLLQNRLLETSGLAIALTMLNLVETERAMYGNTVPLKIHPAMVVTIRHHHCLPPIPDEHRKCTFLSSFDLPLNLFEACASNQELLQWTNPCDLSICHTIRKYKPLPKPLHHHQEGFRKRFVLPELTFLTPSLYVCIMTEELQRTFSFSSDLSVNILLRITSGSSVYSPNLQLSCTRLSQN